MQSIYSNLNPTMPSEANAPEPPKRPNAPVTLIELGKRLNLSPRAVSEVLNGGNPRSTVRVHPKTRERVQKLANELGYRANRSAQTLRLGKRRGMIGILLHSGLESVWAEKTHFANRHAEANGYLLMPFYPRYTEPEGNSIAVEFFLDYRVEAVVLLRPLPEEGIKNLLDRGIHVLSIGAAKPPDIRGYFPDKMGASKLLVRHLLGRGNKRISLVGPNGDGSQTHSAQILSGFNEAIEEARRLDQSIKGEFLQPEVALDGFMARDYPGIHGLCVQGYAAMQEKIAAGDVPDAVIGMIPSVAQGAIGALTEAGIAVPEQVAVAGFGDDPWGCTGKLGLTGVRLPNDAMCARAFSDLKAFLEGGQPLPKEDVYLPCELVIRDSTRTRKSATSPAKT